MNNKNVINPNSNNRSKRQNANNNNILNRHNPNNNIQRSNMNQNNINNIHNSRLQNQNLNSRQIVPYNNNNNQNNNNRRNNFNSPLHNDFWHRIDSRRNQNLNNNLNHNRHEIDGNNMNDELMSRFFEDDFFANFFNDNEDFSPSPIRASHIHIRINNHGSPNRGNPHIFIFSSPFGMHHREFRRNYLSNFDRIFLSEIARILSSQQNGGGENAHPPASEGALNKLKRFPLTEKFCKKNEGKMELPNCCICQNEIELGKETVLLPCGHMYHWECCLQWLKTNNTCPICRFEIKEN